VGKTGGIRENHVRICLSVIVICNAHHSLHFSSSSVLLSSLDPERLPAVVTIVILSQKIAGFSFLITIQFRK